MNDYFLTARGGVDARGGFARRQESGLEVLRPQYNDIDSKGIKSLADAQDKLPKLRRVELNGNKFNEDEASLERLKEVLYEWQEKFGPMDELDELEEKRARRKKERWRRKTRRRRYRGRRLRKLKMRMCHKRNRRLRMIWLIWLVGKAGI